MSILVVCPGCHSRFKVSDRFAGKSGACPKCKATIQVPTKDQEVKVHAPTEFDSGGRGATGKLALKPIAREEVRLTPLIAGATLGVIVVMVAGAWLGGAAFESSGFLRAVGLVVVSPVLVWAGYTFLRDPELEPYQGQPLIVRIGILASVYVLLWGLFAYVSDYMILDQAWSWLAFGAPFVVVGGLAALAFLDLDFGIGVFHYTFYVLVTVVLRWCAGMGWLWQATD